jgi:uncharacterized protein (UPF0332 family)
MTREREPRLARSREELEAARVLADSGFHAQAVSRAYYAGFYAAAEALLVLGETRSKHSGVVAAFARLVVKEGGVEEEIGRSLRSLFDQRNTADYGHERVSSEQAEAALATAGKVVAAVERWLAVRKASP